MALFGNSHVAARAFPGRHTVTMRHVQGYTASGMGGDSAGDWSAMLAAAVRLKSDSVWPAYAVISVGRPALSPRPDGPARRRRLQEGRQPYPVPPHRDAPTAAANVIGSTETFVRALQLQVPGPVIEPNIVESSISAILSLSLSVQRAPL